MASLWIVLSTRWDLSSVQASLNVIISILGTIGLWSFTRFWWRRGCTSVLHKDTGVPLSRLFSIGGLGEGWDAMTILRRQLFAKENWHLLVQLIVVAGVTLTCALAGPIAKVALRDGLIVVLKPLQVLPAVQGGGYFGNALFEEVLWNDTTQSLISAGFPDDQLLDFLPPSLSPSWIYVANEWDPTWKINCTYDDDVILENSTGTADSDFWHPIDAFSSYRETYDPAWLDASRYRVTSDFMSFQNWSETNQFREVFFFTLIQSDPEINDRMLYNNETMELSISVLHAGNFKVLYDNTGGTEGGSHWLPIGPIGHASYSRAECTLTRKPLVADEDRIPWPWTNDTASIAKAYTTFHTSPFVAAAAKKQTVVPPSARELVRFYQVYMASTNTQKSSAVPRILSVETQTVELSVIFLITLIILSLLTAWSSIRYAIFLRRNKTQLEELYLPDGRIEWMIHAVKSSEAGIDAEANADWKKRKDSEHFCTAIIGPDLRPGTTPFDAGIRAPRLARVQSCRSSSMSDMASRRFSVSPARSNLGSVSETGREADDERSQSASNHTVDDATRSQEMLPMVRVTTDSSTSTDNPTASRGRATSSTLSVPSPHSPRSPHSPELVKSRPISKFAEEGIATTSSTTHD